LAESLSRLGQVIVFAPDRERSGSSHSLTLHRPLRVNKIKNDWYCVDGTPTDCISVAVNGILKRKPDLVASGINSGANLGDDIFYSGTVAAALEAAIMGIPAFAISVTERIQAKFDIAAEFAFKIAKKILEEGIPKNSLLNINVPNIEGAEIPPHEITTQGKRNYGDIIVEKTDPRGEKYYWIGGNENGFIDIPGTDCNVLMEKKISVTPLRCNYTDYELLEKVRHWQL
jgi:5'-nucleotidase